MKEIVLFLSIVLVCLSGCALLPIDHTEENAKYVSKIEKDFENTYSKASEKGKIRTIKKKGSLAGMKNKVVEHIESFGYMRSLLPEKIKMYENFRKQTEEDIRETWFPSAGSRGILVKFTEISDNMVQIEIINDSSSQESSAVDKEIDKIISLI